MITKEILERNMLLAFDYIYNEDDEYEVSSRSERALELLPENFADDSWLFCVDVPVSPFKQSELVDKYLMYKEISKEGMERKFLDEWVARNASILLNRDDENDYQLIEMIGRKTLEVLEKSCFPSLEKEIVIAEKMFQYDCDMHEKGSHVETFRDCFDLYDGEDMMRGFEFSQDGPEKKVIICKTFAGSNDMLNSIQKVGEMVEDDFCNDERFIKFLKSLKEKSKDTHSENPVPVKEESKEKGKKRKPKA